MFCPKCKYEYRKGFTVCSDCGTPLVEALPSIEEGRHPHTKPEYTDYELILTALAYTDIALIKSVFDSESIAYFIQGESMGIAPGGLPARVLVKKEQAEEAKQLLKEYNIQCFVRAKEP